MRRTLGALVAAALVPVLVLSGTQAANAATNLNVWHTSTTSMHGGYYKDTLECSVTSRYSPNGYGVQWANSECIGGPEASPGWAQPGEPGAKIRLEFRGTYDGAAAPSNYAETTHANEKFAFDAGASTCVTKVCTSGKVAFTNISGGTFAGLSGSQQPVMAAVCWNLTTPPPSITAAWVSPWMTGSLGNNYRKADGSYGSPWAPGTNTYMPYTCPAGQYLYAVAMGLNAAPTLANVWTIQQTVGPGIPVEGEGAGNPCVATSSTMTLAEYPGEDGWKGIASRIPDGSLAVPATYGHCIPDQVCTIHVTTGGPFPAGESEACAETDWGAPAAVPGTGDTSTEPVAPSTHGHDLPPTPTTEPGFWEAILGLLAAGFNAVKDAVYSLGAAIAGIAGAILGGLSALFVPHPSSWDTQGLLDQLNARPPFSVVGDLGTTVSATADSYSSGSGCGSIADFHAPGGGGEITCSSMKSTPGYGTLFTLVQVGLWAMTGFAVFNLFAARARSGDGP